MEITMRRISILVIALFGSCALHEATAGPAAAPAPPPIRSLSQMLQCNSPDPARAIIGCSTIINGSAPADLMSAAYNQRGSAYEQRGEHDLAIADFNSAVKINPKNGEALRNRGDYHLAQNDVAMAMADYNQALAINPKSAEAFNQRGNAYMASDDIMHAMADYNQ